MAPWGYPLFLGYSAGRIRYRHILESARYSFSATDVPFLVLAEFTSIR